MVRRTDLIIESWMAQSKEKRSARVAQWQAWWKAHNGEFKLVRNKESIAVLDTIQRLNNPNYQIKIQAAKLLGRTGDKTAVAPLCRILTELDPALAGKYNHDSFVDACCFALASLGDSKAAPALKRAWERGVWGRHGLAHALAALGDESFFPLVLEMGDKKFYVGSSLYHLARRTNLTIEPWMAQIMGNSPKRLNQWRAWWKTNKDNFKYVRTLKQVQADIYREHKKREQKRTHQGRGK